MAFARETRINWITFIILAATTNIRAAAYVYLFAHSKT